MPDQPSSSRPAITAIIRTIAPNGVQVAFVTPSRQPTRRTERLGRFYGARSLYNEIAYGLRKIGHPLEEREGMEP